MNIELLTLSEATKVEGEQGNFTVTIKKSPRFVHMDKCIGCGACAEKCPAKTDDEYNSGLSKRKAAYVPYPQAVPLKYVIDKERCIYFRNGKCKACEKFCPTGAINFNDEEEIFSINVGAVIFTGGLQPFNPGDSDIFSYKDFPNVVTSLEFERILSAGGPTGGHVIRPSDGNVPSKIAWLQCVGSRDLNRCDNAYCSSVCCMYAVKEAMMASEHVGPELESSIFFMDMRTHGKDFEKYYNRAVEKGISFIRSRIHSILENGDTGDLNLRYTTESGETVEETFQMVVLSVGMEPSPNAIKAAGDSGILLNDNRFAATESFLPVSASRPGIYLAGAVCGPKDIPQSVVEASAASCAAGAGLRQARGTMTKDRKFPAEKNVGMDEPRIGVFVCNCGTNIGGIADVPAIAQYARSLPHVVQVEENLFTCSQDTQDRMIELVGEHNLNRVVVAACSPRTHEPLFQETIRNAGLNPYLFEMANIRNQCTWVHSGNRQEATAKSKDLVRMAVARASLLEPISELSIEVNRTALIVGGGVSGMTAALNVAAHGYEVVIVEKSNRLGGAAEDIKTTWRGDRVSGYLDDLIRQVEQSPGIRVLKEAEIDGVSGFVGNFESSVSAGGGTEKISHGVVILATGAVASETEEYFYGKNPRVGRWHELEKKIEEFNNVESIVFIQCVGSRNDERPYCSRICCTSSVNQAVRLKEHRPETDIYIVYRDMRTFGEMEDLYRKAREMGIIFIRYDLDRKPLVKQAGEAFQVLVFDPVLQRDIAIKADLINLATAIEPVDNGKIAALYKVPLNEENFFMEAHAKLRPVDFASEGIFLCGLAHYPKPLDESIAQATAAAGRAVTVLSRSTISISPLASRLDPEKCIGCGLCVEGCSFGAIVLEPVEGKGLRARNIPASCKGCGLCAATCPQHAIDMLHFSDRQITASMSAAG